MPETKRWHTAEYRKELYDRNRAQELEQARQHIGTRARMLVGPARFDVAVLDVERRLGVLHYHIEPARGEGRAWLCAERLRFGGQHAL